MPTIVKIAGSPGVQILSDGSVAVLAGPVDDPIGFITDRAGALRLADRLVSANEVEAEGPEVTTPAFKADHIRIFAPEAGAPGRLEISGPTGKLRIFIEWPDLVVLADTARLALESIDPDGIG